MVRPLKATALEPMSAPSAANSSRAARATASGAGRVADGSREAPAGGRAAVMPSTARPCPPSTERAKPRAATSSAVTGRTQAAPRHAGSVTRFCSSQALYPAAKPRISSFASRLGPRGAGWANSLSTVPARRTPRKYRSLERFVPADDSERSDVPSAPKKRERSPRTVTNPSASTQTWSAACAQPVPKPRSA